MRSVVIKGIAYHLPAREVTNAELAAEHPAWDIPRVEARAGVRARRIAAPGETALDLAVEACRKLFASDPAIRDEIQGIAFCTQSEDQIMPPNGHLLHKALELREDLFVFDFNLACSGFVYGLALARGLIASGTLDNILLVNADTYSRYIYPGDRATRTLFGDGAAATFLSAAAEDGIVDLVWGSSGKGGEKFTIPAGGLRQPASEATKVPTDDGNGNLRTLENIHMDGLGVLTFFNTRIPRQVAAILEANHMRVEDIDLFVFHQASRVVLESLTRQLKIDPSRVFSNLHRVGNLVSASIPVALKDAMDEGRAKRGDRILVSGFGVGLSWATAIITL